MISNAISAASTAIEARLDSGVGTETVWQEFSVPYTFPVIFTRELFAPANPVLRDVLCRHESDKKHRIIMFIDAGVVSGKPDILQEIKKYADTHANSIDLTCPPIQVAAGETIKSETDNLTPIREHVAKHNIDRHSFVIAIGGGAVLDAVGYVAATAHRGIRHIRIPTTVLAQNDSGVGVKNGINQFNQKNYLGTFCPPFAVLNDSKLLDTLPEREKLAGMAEAIKVALIRDKDFFAWLENNVDALKVFSTEPLGYLIKRCAVLHMRQIGQGGDPFELGSARPLDFGHWAAHRLETMSAHRLRHGEAVAIGIALDVRYAVLAGLLDAANEHRITHLMKNLGFALWDDVLDKRAANGQREVLAGLEHFRAHLGGELTITLLSDIGASVDVHAMDNDLLDQAISDLQNAVTA